MNIDIAQQLRRSVLLASAHKEYKYEYLTVEATASMPIILYWNASTSAAALPRTISYSTDQVNWTEATSSYGGTQLVTLSPGEKVYLKGENSAYATSGSAYNYFSSLPEARSTDSLFEVSGNINSLLYGDDFVRAADSSVAAFCFTCLFSSSSVVSAENLILPATALDYRCYYRMFVSCTSLTQAPKTLPATTLAEGCYENMFGNCSSLTTAPELPATVLEMDCYRLMFQSCSSIVTAPYIPATTLAFGCCEWMFNECTALANVQEELPATVAAQLCYHGMFQGCTNLVTPPALPATALARSCYTEMFSGCVKLETAPELPATTLADSCYSTMFRGCHSLERAPVLPATELATYCYASMFQYCYSLNYIKMMAITLATYSLSGWFDFFEAEPPSVGVFVKNAAAEWDATGASGVPTGWTIEYETV